MKPSPEWLSPLTRKDEDDPRNWKPCNRPLSPAERQYLYRLNGTLQERESWD